MLALDEKVAALGAALRGGRIPHAFGGAIALAYYATPRGTHDVDINLFVRASAFDRVLGVLAPLGVAAPSDEQRRLVARDEQIRIHWDRTPLDLFFSYDALHDACMERRRKVPFGPDKIEILSPEDLAIFKVLFARDKDWRDLAEMLFAQGERFDAAYVVDWLERIVDPSDERLLRLRGMLSEEPA